MGTIMAVVHILAAVFLVGPMAVLPMAAGRAIRESDARALNSLTKTSYAVTVSSMAVLVVGFGALGMRDVTKAESATWSFSSTWIWLSVLLYGVALVLSFALVLPGMRDAAEQMDNGADITSAASKVAVGSWTVSLLLMAVVVLMIIKV